MELTKQAEGLKPEILFICKLPWVTGEWLKKVANISDAAIRQNCSKNRKWESNRIGGKRWINYSSISTKFKIDNNLPLTIEELNGIVIANENHKSKLKNSEILFFIFEELKDAFEHGYAKHVPTYLKFYPADNQVKKRNLNARRHSVLERISELTDKKREPHYTKKDVLDAYSKFYNELAKPGYGKSWRLFSDAPSMSRKLKEFQEDTVACILHGRTNKKLSYEKKNPKLNDFTIAKIETWASDKRAFSIPIIHRLVMDEIEKANEIRIQNNKGRFPEISLSYVKHYLNKPEVKNGTLYFRNKRQYDRVNGLFIRRKNAEFACDVWMGDGTSSQIPYIDANGKAKRGSLFVFRDVMSGKIVGYDVAENEDRHNLIDALHLAISTFGYVPHEIVLDNASSTKTEEFKSIKALLLKMGVIVRYAKVGNAKDKAQVERWNRHFQNNFERFIPGYVGEGVASKIDKGRIDDEFLKETAKQGKLLNWDQLQNELGKLIAWYNASLINGHSPNELFEKSEKKNAYKIEPHKIAMMFWKNTIVTVRNTEIIIEVRKQKYIYDLSYHKDILKYNGTKVRVYYDDINFDYVFVENDRGEDIGEVRIKKQPPLAKANRDDREDIEIIKQHSHNEKLNRDIEKRAAEKARKGQEYAGPEINSYAAINPLELKENIKAAEDDILLRNYLDRKGLVSTEIKPVTEVTQDNPYLNPDYGKRPTNVNIINKRGSNEVLETAGMDRDDL